jgi:hypothetical protein
MLPINTQRSRRCLLLLLLEDTVQPNGLATDRQSNVVPLILGTPGWVRKSGKNSAVLAVLGMVGLQSKADSGTACQIWKVYFGSHNGAVWVFQMPFFAYGQQYPGSRRSDRCRPATYLIDGKVICGRPIFS